MATITTVPEQRDPDEVDSAIVGRAVGLVRRIETASAADFGRAIIDALRSADTVDRTGAELALRELHGLARKAREPG